MLNGATDGFMWGGIGDAVSAAVNAIRIIRAVRLGKVLEFNKHGLEQAMGRDGGRGVTDAAIRHTLKNPKEVVPQKNGALKYVGKQSVVVINEAGKTITTWAKSSKYWR